MKPPRKNQRPLEGARRVSIDRLAAGGDGVGRIGAKVVFVPRTAPGDEADVEVVVERPNWCRGRVVRIVVPGPARVAPPCPAFGDCGGCDWQHLNYPAQLAAKGSIVEDALRRIGRLDPPRIASTLPSPLELGYRHRARLHASRRGGAVAFGFFRAGSVDVVPIDTCPVLHPALNRVLGALAETGRRHPCAFASCREARIDTGWDGAAVRLLLRGEDGEPAGIPERVSQALRETAAAGGVGLFLDDRGGVPLTLGPGPDALVTTGETFTQINLRQNLTLVDLTVALAAPVPGEEVLDLCCGLGNLSLPAAALGARVTGVDLDRQAVSQARENARRLGREATFVCDDAVGAIRRLVEAKRRFPLVLLNPPRAGALGAVAAIPALSPDRVVVVSCDPATLARDAAAFARSGYTLASVQPLDLFPQTAHVETITIFRRTG